MKWGKIFGVSIVVWLLRFVVSFLAAFVEGAIFCAAWCSLAQMFGFVEMDYWSAFIIMWAFNMIISKFTTTNVKISE